MARLLVRSKAVRASWSVFNSRSRRSTWSEMDERVSPETSLRMLRRYSTYSVGQRVEKGLRIFGVRAGGLDGKDAALGGLGDLELDSQRLAVVADGNEVGARGLQAREGHFLHPDAAQQLDLRAVIGRGIAGERRAFGQTQLFGLPHPRDGGVGGRGPGVIEQGAAREQERGQNRQPTSRSAETGRSAGP